MSNMAWSFPWAAAASPQPAAEPRGVPLRPMPNEAIHVFEKKIDNTRVVREQDPEASKSCWKAISAACLAAVTTVGLVVPGANSYLAGYRISELTRTGDAQKAELLRLTVREAELTSPAAMARAASNQNFIETPAANLVVLHQGRSGDVAMNVSGKEEK
jgi:hypothetical protein